MIKIIYAASNSVSSKTQLERFIKSVDQSLFKIKIAAYRKSTPNFQIDWTLDALLDVFNSSHINLDSDNIKIYYDQIKSFNPDLIISDLEYYTSYLANLLNIPLWQCNSSLINFALDKKNKYNLGIFKNYSILLNKNPQQVQRVINILDNSDARLIYSHFGDVYNFPNINDKYEWIRPYHYVGKKSALCNHNIVVASNLINKNLLDKIKHYQDIVLFSNNLNENYSNIKIKNINDYSEYFCNLYNSNLFICDSQINFLADSFYNGKKSFFIPNYLNTESIINNSIAEKFNISKNFYDVEHLNEEETSINLYINPKIKFLHEKLLEYFY